MYLARPMELQDQIGCERIDSMILLESTAGEEAARQATEFGIPIESCFFEDDDPMPDAMDASYLSGAI